MSLQLRNRAATSGKLNLRLLKVSREWQTRTGKNSGACEALYHACEGFFCALQQERMLRIHVMVSLGLVAAGLMLQLDYLRWSVLLISIIVVLGSELINTALERLCDMSAGCKLNQLAREAKDIAAAAVLCSMIGTFLLWAMTLGPAILDLYAH